MVDWAGFGVWCGRVFGGRYGRDVFRYAVRFGDVLFSGNASCLLSVSGDVRVHAMKGLSALAKFLGGEWVERWRRIREAYGLKWSSSDGIHPLVCSYAGFNEMVEYLRSVVASVPSSRPVVFYALLTGLRPSEVFESMRLLRDRLDGYFNAELGVLEHFRFPVFLKKSKKAYVSVYLDVLKDLAGGCMFRSYNQFRLFLKRKGLPCHLAYARKVYATYLRKHGVDPEIIDLLQGRVAKSMFVRHYYRPDINVEFSRVREVLSGMLVELGFENMLKAS